VGKFAALAFSDLMLGMKGDSSGQGLKLIYQMDAEKFEPLVTKPKLRPDDADLGVEPVVREFFLGLNKGVRLEAIRNFAAAKHLDPNDAYWLAISEEARTRMNKDLPASLSQRFSAQQRAALHEELIQQVVDAQDAFNQRLSKIYP